MPQSSDDVPDRCIGKTVKGQKCENRVSRNSQADIAAELDDFFCRRNAGQAMTPAMVSNIVQLCMCKRQQHKDQVVLIAERWMQSLSHDQDVQDAEDDSVAQAPCTQCQNVQGDLSRVNNEILRLSEENNELRASNRELEELSTEANRQISVMIQDMQDLQVQQQRALARLESDLAQANRRHRNAENRNQMLSAGHQSLHQHLRNSSLKATALQAKFEACQRELVSASKKGADMERLVRQMQQKEDELEDASQRQLQEPSDLATPSNALEERTESAEQAKNAVAQDTRQNEATPHQIEAKSIGEMPALGMFLMWHKLVTLLTRDLVKSSSLLSFSCVVIGFVLMMVIVFGILSRLNLKSIDSEC